MIETQRLKLIPLTYKQLQLYLQQSSLLEKQLRVKISNTALDPQLSEAIEKTLLPNLSDPQKNYLHCTLWAIVLKKENCMVGSFCFADTPNEAGEIEIGYGIEEPHRSKGYLGETLSGIATWAKSQHEIKTIIAETSENNLSSVHALLKNKFVQYKKQESRVWFKYDCEQL